MVSAQRTAGGELAQLYAVLHQGCDDGADDVELARLDALLRYPAADAADDAELGRIARLAVQLTGCSMAAVNLIEADRQVQAATVGFRPVTRPRSAGMCTRVVETARPVYAPDTLQDPVFVTNPHVTGELASFRTYAGSPLLTPDGHAIGALCVVDDAPRLLSQDQLNALDDLAAQVMTLFEVRRQSALVSAALVEADQQADRSERLIATASDAFVATSASGTVIGWNAAAEALLGHRADEVLGRPLSDAVVPDGLRAADPTGLRWFIGTDDGDVGLPLELEARHADGSTIPVERTLWATPDGDDFRYHAFLRDLRPQRASEAATRRHLHLTQTLTRVTELVTSGDVADVQGMSRGITAEVSRAFGDTCALLLHPGDRPGLRVSTVCRGAGADAGPVLLRSLDREAMEQATREALTSGAVVLASAGAADASPATGPDVSPATGADASPVTGPDASPVTGPATGADAGSASLLFAPLVAHGEGLGVLVLVRGPGRAAHGPDDVTLAREVAARAAGVLECARLYADLAEAQRRSAAQERFLQTVMDSVPAATAVLAADGTIEHVNAVWSTFGRDNGGDATRCGVGANYLAVCGASGAASGEARAADEGIRAVLDGRQDRFSMEYECPDADGNPRWFTVVAAPLADEHARRAVVLHEDITVRRVGEQALRENAQLLAHTPAVVVARDLQGRYLFVNEEYERLWGVTAAEVTGRSDADTLPPEQLAVRRAADARVAASGEPETRHEEVLARGDRRSYVTTRFPLHTGDGTLRGVAAISIDDTARRRSEEALRASEERYLRVTHDAPGVVYQYELAPDGASSFPFVSAGVRELLDLDPEHVMADPRLFLDAVHAADQAAFAATIAESAQRLTPWRWEGRAVRGDGRVRWIEGTSRPVRLADGTTHWDGILLDRTESKLVEIQIGEQAELLALQHEALGHSHAELEAANLLKLDLMGMLSHEIGTPLTAIRGHAELLADVAEAGSAGAAVDVGPSVLRSVAVIERNVERLDQLRTEVLLMCAMDAGRLVAHGEPVDLEPAVRQALHACDVDVPVEGVEGLRALVSPAHLQHVLINFLSNARKYADGPTRVHLVAEGGDVVVEVHDEGAGVPESLRPRLFERFVRGDDAGARAQGTGLGLHIVRSLVEANGGSVEHRHNAPRGSVFSVRLPSA